MDSWFDAERLVGSKTTTVAFVGAIGIMLVAGAIFIDVLMRWLFNSPILGVDDLSKYLLAVVIASFFPVGLARGHFVTIRFLGKALGRRATLWLEVLGATGTFLLFIMYAWKIGGFSLDVTRSGLATVVLEFAVAPWWWCVTVIFCVCVVVQAIVLVDRIVRALTGRQPAHESSHSEAASTGG